MHETKVSEIVKILWLLDKISKEEFCNQMTLHSKGVKNHRVLNVIREKKDIKHKLSEMLS